MVWQLAQAGHPDEPCSRFGTLTLLGDHEGDAARFWIQKKITLLGRYVSMQAHDRAMTSDVRLLLGDVSRVHARICMDENDCAFLEVLGTNGLWHNDKLIQPESPPPPWPLSEGDVLRISQHKFCFSYATVNKENGKNCEQEPQQAVAEQQTQPSPSSTESSPDNKTAKQQAAPTPMRRSARIRARTSLPSLRHGWTPEKALRPVPLTQLPTTSVHHRLDLASPSTGKIRPRQREPAPPDESLREVVEDDRLSSSKEEEHALHDTDPPFSLAASPTKQDISQEMDLSSMDPNCKEAEQDDAWDDVDENDENASVGSVGLRMEDTSRQSEPICEPTSSSSPARVGTRYPMVARQQNGTPSPLIWSPSKSRKVSLRTATLLKRSAQLPVLPIPETTRRTPLPAQFAEPASSGSLDMDISSTMPLQESDNSSSDDESEVERSLELQVHPEAQEEPPSATNTPHGIYLKPRVLSQKFLTPQVERGKNPAHRRLSLEYSRLSTNASATELEHKSSWQWLKGKLSPGKQNRATAEKASDATKTGPDPGVDNELQKSILHEKEVAIQNDQDTAHIQRSEESDDDDFFDTDDELTGKVDDPDTTTTKDDNIPALSSLLVHPPEPVVSNSSYTPSNRQSMDALPTPDMHLLKHVFAEPKPTMTAESTMADFRHLIYHDERNTATASDMSLGSVWAALEMDTQKSKVEPSQYAMDMYGKQDNQRPAAMSKSSLHVPDPLKGMSTQHRADNDITQRVNSEFTPMTQRSVRSITKKEPYVPVRRQLPQRNAVKSSRIGSLSTTATRISTATGGDVKENLPKMSASIPAAPVHAARSTADNAKATFIPVPKSAGTKSSSTMLTHRNRRTTRAMESRTNVSSHDGQVR